MNCQWSMNDGVFASDEEWEIHLQACAECQTNFHSQLEMNSVEDDVIKAYYAQPISVPPTLAADIMTNLEGSFPTHMDAKENHIVQDKISVPLQTGITSGASTRNLRTNPHWVRRGFGATAAAAVLVLGVSLTFHTQFAQAMSHVIEQLDTTFFAQEPHPVQVKVTQVTPAQQTKIEQDLLSPQQVAQAKVFAKHEQQIINTYNELPNGGTRGLKFADGTGFDVVKQPVVRDITSLLKTAKGTVPVLTQLPDHLQFDKGSVRMSGMGDSTAEINMLFTPNRVTQRPEFQFEQYTDQSFRLARGTYLSLNMTVSDGVLGTSFVGNFQSKQTVSVQGQPGVLMQYSTSWKPQPGITVLSFGLNLDGHRYMILLNARNLTPEQVLQIGNHIKWETAKK